MTTGEPSPKSHVQPVGLPVDRSVIVTVSGATPLVGVTSKTDTSGGGAAIATVRVAVVLPAAFPAVRTMSYVPGAL